jgi:hypothetical protein
MNKICNLAPMSRWGVCRRASALPSSALASTDIADQTGDVRKVPLEVALEMKIARKRLLKSSLLIVSQAAINAGFVGFFLLSVAQSVSPWASHAIHE